MSFCNHYIKKGLDFGLIALIAFTMETFECSWQTQLCIRQRNEKNVYGIHYTSHPHTYYDSYYITFTILKDLLQYQ